MDRNAFEKKMNNNEPFELKHEEININNSDYLNMPKKMISSQSPLYIMTVDLDEEKSEKLEIYLNSIPEKLAYDFGKKHNLDFDAMQFLVDEITKLLVVQSENPNPVNIDEPIQEVDEDMNSELYKTNDLEKSRMKKEEISSKKEEAYQNILPSSDKSSASNTNKEFNKSNKISSSQLNTLNNQTLNSISKGNNVSKSSKVEANKPIDIKQFSFQLFLDKSNKPELTKINKPQTESNKSSIFDKLYQEAKLRKINKNQAINKDNPLGIIQNKDISNSNKTNSQDKELLNYGERLYIKGMKLKQNSSKKIEKIKIEKESLNKENYTFKPKLMDNDYDNYIELIKVCKFLTKGRINNNKSDIILNYQQYKEEQIEKLKHKHQKEEVYPFSPKINKNTEMFLNPKASNMNNFVNESNNNLTKPLDFNDRYKQRMVRLKMLEDSIYKNTFTPTINNNIPLQSTFSERQEAFKKRVRDHSEE